jgi:signal transduction histidine kinase
VYQTSRDFQGQPLAIYVAEDHSDMEQALWLFDGIVAVFVVLSLGVIYALQQRLLRRSFKQLDPIYQALDGLQKGHPFYVNADDYPQEVQPLITKLNEALQSAQSQLQRSRQASSNLAHSLKTPLNILFQLRQHPVVAEHPELKATLQAQTDTIHQRLETELQAASIASQSARLERFSPQADLPDLLSSMQQLYPDKAWHTHPPLTQWPAQLPLEKNDGFELLGNLLDNAAKFSRHDYHLTYDTDRMMIDDDGPGVPETQRQHILKRGVRLDETKPGHGVGLAIASQIAEAYDLTFEFDTSPYGGLRVQITWLKEETDA